MQQADNKTVFFAVFADEIPRRPKTGSVGMTNVCVVCHRSNYHCHSERSFVRNLITSHEEKAGHIACLQDRWLTRDVPLNADAVSVLRGELGKHPQFCFTYRGNPIKWDLTNTAWENALQKAGIENLLFHDLRHTWASWRRQSGTSTDEL